jgi:hypothetical protein
VLSSDSAFILDPAASTPTTSVLQPISEEDESGQRNLSSKCGRRGADFPVNFKRLADVTSSDSFHGKSADAISSISGFPATFTHDKVVQSRVSMTHPPAALDCHERQQRQDIWGRSNPNVCSSSSQHLRMKPEPGNRLQQRPTAIKTNGKRRVSVYFPAFGVINKEEGNVGAFFCACDLYALLIPEGSHVTLFLKKRGAWE